MRFHASPPPPDLAPWIETAWLLHGALAPAGEVILPDGRMELVFHLAEPPREAGQRQPSILLAGQRAHAVELFGSLRAVGVRWRPGAIPLEDPSNSAWARQTRESLGDARDPFSALWPALRALRRRQPDLAVSAAIEAGRPLQAPAGLSLRQWQRRFRASTGYGPKEFARLARFQQLIALYRAGHHRRWAQLALEAGFYDQAHLANEFRAFSGQSPDAFFHHGRGMVEFERRP